MNTTCPGGATADYGTNAAGDTYTYTSGSAPLDTSANGSYWDHRPDPSASSPIADVDGDGNVTACNVESLGAAVHVTCYGYDGGGMGTSRRIGMALGSSGQITQTFAGGDGYTGLDRFGRVKDVHYVIGTDKDHRYEYGYDKAGNRTYARATQAAFGSTTHVNDRSYLYAYDGLQRLVNAHMGKLDLTSTPAIVNDASVALERELTWTLDNLGNWTGDSVPTPGLSLADDTDGDGYANATHTFTHAVDHFNTIAQVTTDSVSQDYITDANGNLICDGVYVYQYDAWNRLIAVNGRGTLEPDDFVATAGADLGRIAPDPGDNPVHTIGAMVYRFRYDGLGRLIEREEFLGTGAVNQARLYETRHYYYDGVRQVQEVVETPDLDQTGPTTFHTEREYVYGPEYVDEYVAQMDDPGDVSPPLPSFMLQDANFNVMALVSLPTTGGPTVLSQYQYEPYGHPATEDHDASITTANENTVGHQGLFFHKLAGAGLSLAPDSHGLYYNRNRWYSPSLGRFLTRDPNATGQLLISALAMNGEAVAVLADAFDSSGHFGDGMNLYGYLSANPAGHVDPLGLHDPFDEVDQWVDERVGNALYVLGELNEGATLALGTALDIASILLGLDVFQSVAVLANGTGGFWDAMDIVISVTPVGRLGKAVGRIARAAKWGTKGGRLAKKLVRHHTVPRAVLEVLDPKVAANGLVRGKRGARNVWDIPEDVHKEIHRGARGGHWNRRWWEELGGKENADKATVERVVEIREKLVREFGLGEYRP